MGAGWSASRIRLVVGVSGSFDNRRTKRFYCGWIFNSDVTPRTPGIFFAAATARSASAWLLTVPDSVTTPWNVRASRRRVPSWLSFNSAIFTCVDTVASSPVRLVVAPQADRRTTRTRAVARRRKLHAGRMVAAVDHEHFGRDAAAGVAP